jgi:hypothetical protein
VSSDIKDQIRAVGGIKVLVNAVARIEHSCLYAVLRALTILVTHSSSNQDEIDRIDGLNELSPVLLVNDLKG